MTHHYGTIATATFRLQIRIVITFNSRRRCSTRILLWSQGHVLVQCFRNFKRQHQQLFCLCCFQVCVNHSHHHCYWYRWRQELHGYYAGCLQSKFCLLYCGTLSFILTLLFGIFTCNSRGVTCCTALLSFLSLAMVLVSAGLVTGMYMVIRNLINNHLKSFGISASLSSQAMGVAWDLRWLHHGVPSGGCSLFAVVLLSAKICLKKTTIHSNL